MLGRYSKAESISSGPYLPRLCLQRDQDFDRTRHSNKYIPDNSNHCSRRGCDSAPILLDQNFSSLHFIFDEKNLGYYPKQLHIHPNSSFPRHPGAEQENLSPLGEINYGQQMTDDENPEADFIKISRCLRLLHESGFYYEGLSWQQATIKLRKCRVGTFLIRESENANFLFTLSVQTKMGPTSIRIAYRGGQFRLDAEEELIHQMPEFSSVTDLIEYYVRVSKQLPVKNDPTCCWLDLAGECTAPVELYQPLYKKVPSLMHITRLSMFKQMLKKNCLREESWTSLGLPVPLRNYLANYPYSQ